MMERRFTTSDNVEIFFADYGDEGGTPLIICHGIAVNATQFIEDAEYLAARGYRVLTPDLRGHGRSSVAPPIPQNYSLDRMARDHTEMLDALGIIRAHYVGNSLGGMVGLSLVSNHPDRLISMSTFGTPWRLGVPSRGMRWFVLINFTLWRPFVIAIAAALCSRVWAVQKRIWKMAWPADARVLGAVTSAITPYDYIASVEGTSVPVMLMHCRRDGLIGWSMGSTLRAARGSPKLRVVDLDNGGHCANLDATDAFRAALLAFLAR